MCTVLTFDDRPSDSPFIDRVWRSRSERGGMFVSIAQSHFEIAVTRHEGRMLVTLRGAEATATPAACPAEGEWLGIRFKLGTFMRGSTWCMTSCCGSSGVTDVPLSPVQIAGPIRRGRR